MCKILMSICECIINAFEYSEKIHTSDEIDSQHVQYVWVEVTKCTGGTVHLLLEAWEYFL